MIRRINLRNPEEIEKIRAAGQIISEVFALAKSSIRPGLSTYELDKLCEKHIRSRGASCPCINYGQPPYPAATCISLNETVVHGVPSKSRILAEGDIVTVDVVVGLNGYMADAARTFPVGTVSPEAEAIIDAAEASFFRGLLAAIPGNRVGDISFAVQSYSESHGYSVIREMTGHGIGVDMHEAPDVPNYGRPHRGPRLEAGMVICIEPMIAAGEQYIMIDEDEWSCVMEDGELSAHYENTVAITEHGPEILTMTSDEVEAFFAKWQSK
ncbi:MAG: type I methionyl aminopeptidase [Eubacteriales bacterium]|nr:type I methionyl aminopeptidase [Eubacteriales bacterium]